jgi:hypothetical protein
MTDLFTEVASQSWGHRLIESIKGVLVGLVLFLASFPLLWWNEGRAVQTARSLDEGAASVLSVPSDRVEPANEGKLVHVAGPATTDETLSDNLFGVTAQTLRLVRSVDMLQWTEEQRSEKQKELGGSEKTVTTYSYAKKWSNKLVDSSKFKDPTGHSNPTTWRYNELDTAARNAHLGAFHVPETLLKKLSKLDPLPLDTAMLARAPNSAGIDANAYFVGTDLGNPQVGDLRISYRVLRPQTLSVVAQQVGNTFQAFRAKAGDDVLLIEAANLDAKTMFQTASSANVTLTWVLRGVGFLLMTLGLSLLLRPLVVVADFIPMIGSLVGLSATLFASVIAFALSTLTIGVAWIAVRPLLGAAVLTLALGGIIAVIALAIRSRKQRRARA